MFLVRKSLLIYGALKISGSQKNFRDFFFELHSPILIHLLRLLQVESKTTTEIQEIHVSQS
jgi:hypothetical protein